MSLNLEGLLDILLARFKEAEIRAKQSTSAWELEYWKGCRDGLKDAIKGLEEWLATEGIVL